MDKNKETIQNFLWNKVPNWGKFVIAIIITEIVSAILHLIFQNIGLGEAIVKLPLFVWKGLLFNFMIPVWAYVLSASLPFVFYYILERVISSKTNVSRKKKVRKIGNDDKPDWWNYREDEFDEKLFRWNYNNPSDPTPINLQMICKKCGCELRHSAEDALATRKSNSDKVIYSCPECEEVYAIKDVDAEGVFKHIKNKIRTEKFKEKGEKNKQKSINEFKSLIKRTKELKFKENNELDRIRKKMEMLIRKEFGNESHYINKLNAIYFSSPVVAITNEEFASDLDSMIRSSQESNSLSFWEDGKAKLSNLLETIIEDLEF